jgi:hypothetical protein
MSEVRCAGGHFMGHQKETPPYSFTTTAKLEYIGKEGDYLVYRSSRPHPMREGPVRRNKYKYDAYVPDIPQVLLQAKPPPAGDIAMGRPSWKLPSESSEVEPLAIVICGRKGCGKRAMIRDR